MKVDQNKIFENPDLLKRLKTMANVKAITKTIESINKYIIESIIESVGKYVID